MFAGGCAGFALGLAATAGLVVAFGSLPIAGPLAFGGFMAASIAAGIAPVAAGWAGHKLGAWAAGLW